MSMPQSALAAPGVSMPAAGDGIPDRDFERIRDFLYDTAGIDLAPSKKVLVAARLGKRLRHFGLRCYGEYFALVISGSHPAERQVMLDLLTTNETYFFRESGHFDFLRTRILPGRRGAGPFRVWSAASSSGEEAYSIAMLLADELGTAPWEILGSDLSARVLEAARAGHYSMARTDGIPREYLKKYCLRGTGPQEGTLLIDRKLRERARFVQINLNCKLPSLGEFDVIFLRNVLIYFDADTKCRIVRRVLSVLKPGGHFFIGHSETLKGVNDSVELVAPTTYLKPG